MMAHALKLVWNRKTSNFLIMCELLGALMVLFVLVVVAVTLQTRLAMPLGFDYQDVWQIRSAAADLSPESRDSEVLVHDLIVQEIQAQGPVVAVGREMFGVYDDFRMVAEMVDAEGHTGSVFFKTAGLELRQALDMELVAGRWLGLEDAVQGDAMSIVVNRRLANRFFGSATAAVGGLLMYADSPEGAFRVVGVLEDFRSFGDLHPGELMAIMQERATPRNWNGAAYLVEVEPGAGVAEEEALIRRLQAVAPSWTFEFDRLTDLREQHLRSAYAPLAAGVTVAVFLLLMVGLGLTGVLWQSITRRTREIGLRRAQGATRGAVRLQIVFEMLSLATLSIGVGAVLLVQIPLFGTLPGVEPGTLPIAFALAAAVLYAMTAMCSYYPGLMASRIQPAAALHHE